MRCSNLDSSELESSNKSCIAFDEEEESLQKSSLVLNLAYKLKSLCFSCSCVDIFL